MQRTYLIDVSNFVGKEILIKGFVNIRRDHGKIIFLDMRDMTGLVQVVVVPSVAPDAYKIAQETRSEFVLEIKGEVNERSEKTINEKIPNGKVEILAKEISILAKAETPPFDVTTDGREIGEDVRLRYRYVDLRRPRMQENLQLRSKFTQALRESFFNKDFTEIETPILTKTTMEGARDFVVPSRFQPGKFYALPQSPQQYKQLLMVGGFEKYFQFARCMRDEDLRADRGFEFTQLDVEMSFVDRDDVMNTTEDAVKEAVKKVGRKLKDEKFPVISYKEAIDKYGADKFDLRNEEEKKNGVLAFAWVVDFPFFRQVSKDEVSDDIDSKSEWTFTHNPFSMPVKEHLNDLMEGKNIKDITTAQYDLVCNGLEVGGGSIRAHKPEILKATYKVMGYSEKEIEQSIGHMLEALSFGAPPHGGIALGLDRLIALLQGESSVKETMAFPMTSTGRTAVMDSPSEIGEQQMKELGLKVIK